MSSMNVQVALKYDRNNDNGVEYDSCKVPSIVSLPQ